MQVSNPPTSTNLPQWNAQGVQGQPVSGTRNLFGQPSQQPVFTRPQPQQNVPGPVVIPTAFNAALANVTPSGAMPASATFNQLPSNQPSNQSGSNTGLQTASRLMSATVPQNASNAVQLNIAAAAASGPAVTAQQERSMPGRLTIPAVFLQSGSVAVPQETIRPVAQQNFQGPVVTPSSQSMASQGASTPFVPTPTQGTVPGRLAIPEVFRSSEQSVALPGPGHVIVPSQNPQRPMFVPSQPSAAMQAPQRLTTQNLSRVTPSAQPAIFHPRAPEGVSTPQVVAGHASVVQNHRPSAFMGTQPNGATRGDDNSLMRPTTQGNIPGRLVIPEAFRRAEHVALPIKKPTEASHSGLLPAGTRTVPGHTPLTVPSTNANAQTGIAPSRQAVVHAPPSHNIHPQSSRSFPPGSHSQPRQPDPASSPSLTVWPNTPLKTEQRQPQIAANRQSSAHASFSRNVHPSIAISPSSGNHREPRQPDPTSSPSSTVWPNTPLKTEQRPLQVAANRQANINMQARGHVHSTFAPSVGESHPTPSQPPSNLRVASVQATAPNPFVWRPAPGLPTAPTEQVTLRPPETNVADFKELEHLFKAHRIGNSQKIEFSFGGFPASVLQTSDGEFIIRGNVSDPKGHRSTELDTINMGVSGLKSLRGNGNGSLTPRQEAKLINAVKAMFENSTGFRAAPPVGWR